MSLTTTIIVILSIALFILGAVLGWVFSPNGGNVTRTNNRLKAVVALAVTLVWIAATISDILITGYTISPLVHALMGAVVGYFFTDDGITLNIGGGE